MNNQAVIDLFKHNKQIENSNFVREEVFSNLSKVMSSDRHIVLYGPAGQGKTNLLKKVVSDRRVCMIDGRSDVTKTDIFRILLSNSGYSVRVGRKKNGKFGRRAKLKLFGLSIGGTSNESVEEKTTDLSADLSKGTEVSSLLSSSKPPEFLILNNFDHLSMRTQRSIAKELGIFDELSTIRFIIVGRWLDRYYLEKMSPELSGRLDKVLVPFWSPLELTNYANFAAQKTESDYIETDILKYIIRVSNGDVGTFSKLCRLYYEISQNQKQQIDHFEIEARNFLSERFLDVNFERLMKFCFDRELMVTFSKNLTSTKFRDKTKRFRSPDKVKEFFEKLGIKFEMDRLTETRLGDFEYTYQEEYEDVTRTNHGVLLGLWLLKKFFPDEGQTIDKISLVKAIQYFYDDFLRDANEILDSKLKRILIEIPQNQVKIGIHPRIIDFCPDQNYFSISDPQLNLFMTTDGREEFYENVEDYFEDEFEAKKGKRKNNICKAYDTRSTDIEEY